MIKKDKPGIPGVFRLPCDPFGNMNVGILFKSDVSAHPLIGYLETSVGDEDIDFLEHWFGGRFTSPTLPDRTQAIRESAFTAIDRLVDMLKFTAPIDEISGWGGELSWSTNRADWYTTPLVGPGGYGTRKMSFFTVDSEHFGAIQAQIDANVRAFSAFGDLSHAHSHGVDPRRRWIYATTAAELAIKEFLALSRPELGSLLSKLPSPPLAKLYGEILEEYSTGGRSPALAWMGPGASLRNALIHSPDKIQISQADSWAYTRAVTVAIYDLLARLYPNDDTISKHLKHLGAVGEVPKWIKDHAKIDPPALPRLHALMGNIAHPTTVRLCGKRTEEIAFAPPSDVRLLIEEGPERGSNRTRQRILLKVVTPPQVVEHDCDRLELVVQVPDGERCLVFEPGKPHPYREFYRLFTQDFLKRPSESLPEEDLSVLHSSMRI